MSGQDDYLVIPRPLFTKVAIYQGLCDIELMAKITREPEFERYVKKLGKKIKEVRNKQGITQEQIDDHSEFGIDIKMYQEIEGGRSNPTQYTIWKIAKQLKVKPNEFYNF